MKTKIIIKKILILKLVFLVIFLFSYYHFRPTIKIISVNTAKNIASQIINESVLYELSNNNFYSDIIQIQKNESGEVVSLLSNMNKLNKLKSQVSILIQEKFSKSKNKKISIPIGTLTGIDILNGFGPDVPVNMSIIGNISSEFKSDFQSAGINQTVYKIYINIHAKLSVVVPGCSSIEDFFTNILISETVVLGKVPKAYAIDSENHKNLHTNKINI